MADATAAVLVRGLCKSYRRRGRSQPAVDRLDLNVPVGGVHGFLGPNGAGKTTTIRMLLGLIRPDAGQMTIFGQDVPNRLPDVIGRVGAIVEQPRFFPTFTGTRNLELLADAIGTPRARVGQVLEEVDLSERGRDRFRSYSLGMKQRLAIAATLLKDPDLLIFDEPTNGLDPAGIREIRATMRGLVDRGKTVLISSHILGEVQQVADTVSIIGRGVLLAEGPVAQILAGGAQTTYRIAVADRDRAGRLLTEAGYQAEGLPDGRLSVTATEADPSELTRLLAGHGLYLAELIPIRPNLEQVFLELTDERRLGAPPTSGPATGGPR